jgi:hypothetical protein
VLGDEHDKFLARVGGECGGGEQGGREQEGNFGAEVLHEENEGRGKERNENGQLDRQIQADSYG